MSTVSPSAFLLWSILSVLFLIFLTHHLWSYDRFECLKWNSGRQPRTFKRFMTYSYLGSVPLMVCFSVAMTCIKFKEGWIMLPDGTMIPKPVDLYSKPSQNWLLPLYFIFSGAWAFELITHLEELTFWLFMLHQSPGKGQWFSSWEYRFWCLGSAISILALPMTTLASRHNIKTCDAWIILVGGSGATVITLVFSYVLWKFPIFLRHVKSEGADQNVVVQLYTFHYLNCVRTIFRLLFILPLLVICVDAIMTGFHPVNTNVFWSDFLFMIGGFGCFFSSGMTLLIFFPRSITQEAGYRVKPATPQSAFPPSQPSSQKSSTVAFCQFHHHPLPSNPVSESDLAICAPGMSHTTEIRDFHSLDFERSRDLSDPDTPPYRQCQVNQPSPISTGAYLAPCRTMSIPQLRRVPSLHPYIVGFSSPIDLIDDSPTPSDGNPVTT